MPGFRKSHDFNTTLPPITRIQNATMPNTTPASHNPLESGGQMELSETNTSISKWPLKQDSTCKNSKQSVQTFHDCCFATAEVHRCRAIVKVRGGRLADPIMDKRKVFVSHPPHHHQCRMVCDILEHSPTLPHNNSDRIQIQ